MTETAYQCTTCGKVYSSETECTQHADRHTNKPSQKLGSQKPHPSKWVREVEVERAESDEITLHQIAGESPPEETDLVYLGENEPQDTEPRSLRDYGGGR